jgi:hypothetical protein
VETTPAVLASDPLTTDGYLRRNNLTSSGIVATFSADNGTIGRGTGWHLGGVKNGKWLFKTSPSTHSNYMGEFPPDGTYDIGNYVRNAGNYMQVIDKNIFGDIMANSGKDYKLINTIITMITVYL